MVICLVIIFPAFYLWLVSCIEILLLSPQNLGLWYQNWALFYILGGTGGTSDPNVSPFVRPLS